MWSSILSILVPIALSVLEMWLKRQENKEAMKKSYISFLEQVDKSGQVKVANHIAAVKGLKGLQAKLYAEKLEREKNEKFK